MPDWLWQGLLFLGIGLIPSIIMGIYFYLKAKQTKDIVWCVWTAPLATTYTAQERALQLTYNGEEVRSVGVSWVMLWNTGKAAVSQSDVSRHNPLRLVATGNTRVLGAQPIGSSDPGNLPKTTVAEGGKSVGLLFEFLNYRHGIVVSVVHTGTSPSYISLSGTVINGQPPKELDALSYRLKVIPSFVRAKNIRTSLPDKKRILITAAAVVLTLVSISLVSDLRAVLFILLVVSLTISNLVILWGVVSGPISRRRYPPPIDLEDIDDRRLSPEFWNRNVDSTIGRPPLLF